MNRCRILLFFSFVALSAALIDNGYDAVFKEDSSTSLPMHTFGNKSYLTVTGYKLNFLQAMDFCENMHMTLTSIDTAEINEVIRELIKDAGNHNEFWTSGSKMFDSKSWLWLNSGKPIEYTSWSDDKPQEQTGLCLSVNKMNNGIVWNGSPCEMELPFICERNLNEERENNIEENKNWENIFTGAKDTPNLDLLHFNGKDYHISRDYRGNYLEALDFCQFFDMKLVSINSQEENDKLYEYIRTNSAGKDFWTAGTRLLDGKNWLWLTSGKTMSYTNWGSGQPNNQHDHCIRVYLDKNKGLYWDDANCNSVSNVICEKHSAGTKIIKDEHEENKLSRERREVVAEANSNSENPIVTVYFSNNLITKEGKSVKTNVDISSKDVFKHEGFHVTVDNKLGC